MTCPACGSGERRWFRLLGGDLEEVCGWCGEHLAIVEVDYAAAG